MQFIPQHATKLTASSSLSINNKPRSTHNLKTTRICCHRLRRVNRSIRFLMQHPLNLLNERTSVLVHTSGYNNWMTSKVNCLQPRGSTAKVHCPGSQPRNGHVTWSNAKLLIMESGCITSGVINETCSIYIADNELLASEISSRSRVHYNQSESVQYYFRSKA